MELLYVKDVTQLYSQIPQIGKEQSKMNQRKAGYQINLRINENDNARLANLRKEGYGNIEIFRRGLEATERKIKNEK